MTLERFLVLLANTLVITLVCRVLEYHRQKKVDEDWATVTRSIIKLINPKVGSAETPKLAMLTFRGQDLMPQEEDKS